MEEPTITPRFVSTSSLGAPNLPQQSQTYTEKLPKLNYFHHLWEVKWIVLIIALAIIIIMVILFILYLRSIDCVSPIITSASPPQNQPTQVTPAKPTTILPDQQPPKPIAEPTEFDAAKKELKKIYDVSAEHEVADMISK